MKPLRSFLVAFKIKTAFQFSQEKSTLESASIILAMYFGCKSNDINRILTEQLHNGIYSER